MFAPFLTTAAHHLLEAIRNDSCQLQVFGVVVTDPVDIDELSENGMSFKEFDGKIVNDKFLIIKANVLTNRVDVMESPSNYCLDRFDNMYGDQDWAATRYPSKWDCCKKIGERESVCNEALHRQRQVQIASWPCSRQ